MSTVVKHKVVLHSFKMGDVEDPGIYAAGPIWDWQQTDHGKWCMENAIGELVSHTHVDYESMGYKVSIVGEFSDHDYTLYHLKWGIR